MGCGETFRVAANYIEGQDVDIGIKEKRVVDGDVLPTVKPARVKLETSCQDYKRSSQLQRR
jgi:hypothetical protein